MRRTRFTIATLSMAASAMVLGMPAATAASLTQTAGHSADKGQVQVVGRHQGDEGEGRVRRHHRRHRRITIRRRHVIRWHHRCGPGWDSGWVRGSSRTRIRERDRFRGDDGGGRFRDRGFRDNGDRGWGRGWISTCHWRRGPVVRYVAPRVVYAAPSVVTSAPSRPVGPVRAGEGGSLTNPNVSELALGGSLAALGLAGAVAAARRRSSSR